MSYIVLAGLVAGLGTCLGAFLVIMCGRIRPGTFSLLLGLAAGIMTAVIVFDLLPSSLRYGTPQAALTGFFGGVCLMATLNLGLNVIYPSSTKGRSYLKMGYLIATGIALHDFPEGLAIAAGFEAAEKLGPLLALAIGIHNIPEGMAIAAPLRYSSVSAWRILALNTLISLVTPLGVIAGLALLETSHAFTGLLLAFAAGAMAYIVVTGLAPESRRNDRLLANLGMLAGVALILLLGLIV